jgi:dihydrofolate reductase
VSTVRTSMIVAADEGDVIGRDGGLPWHLPDDLRRFRRLTTGHVVVAGRLTHESIVARLGHPLPGRFTVVVTRRDAAPGPRAVSQPDPDAALTLARGICEFAGRDEVFVIGGAQIYAALLPAVDRVHLTRVHARTAGDTAMPPGWLSPFALVADEPDPQGRFSFRTYERG